MEKQILQILPAPYWYDRPGVIEHWFYGVFEGGGAKGVAYSGALRAMKEKKCWFRGVAGASAGAITAALVAAGLHPEEMEEATDSALKQVQTKVWVGLRRLRNETGYFPSNSLRVWLDNLLKERIAQRTSIHPESGVTFAQLYDTTKIELNIVAADLSLKRQIIFSHNETPNCVVADAVIASSSIPFAFPSRLLQVPEESNGEKLIYHHTIVDGGVWSNFPMFIFEDSAFRRFYNRQPEKIDPERILGFLLKEEDEQILSRAEEDKKEVEFVEAVPVRAREWSQDRHTVGIDSSSLWSRVGAWALSPFSLLGRFAEWNSGVGPGRWPSPRLKWVRNLVNSVNGLLAGIHPLLFALLPCVVVAIGAWEVINFFATDQINVLRNTDWTDPMAYAIRPAMIVLTLLAIAVPILVVFASLIGVGANFLLLRTLRRILYGLVATYISGPGAPEWVTEKKNIVALPIPPGVTTLRFEMHPEERQKLVADAQETTRAKLAKLLSDRSQAA